MLNVVNFGGGAYVIYAEVKPTGEIEVDVEPYSDTFDRPARLLPIEGNALVAAIDHLKVVHADLQSARAEGRGRAGLRPGRGRPAHRLPARRRGDHAHRRARDARQPPAPARVLDAVQRPLLRALGRALRDDQQPRGLVRRRLGPKNEQLRHFRLDRIKAAQVEDKTFEPREGLNPAADIGGWPRTGRIGGSRSARVKVSAEQARWAREQRTVLTELEGGEVVVEYTFKGLDFLVREVLKEAGDAVVLEPADAREAVLVAAEGLIARAT